MSTRIQVFAIASAISLASGLAVQAQTIGSTPKPGLLTPRTQAPLQAAVTQALPAGPYVLSLTLAGEKFQANVQLNRSGPSVDFAIDSDVAVKGAIDSNGFLQMQVTSPAGGLTLRGNAQQNGANGDVFAGSSANVMGRFDLVSSAGATQRMALSGLGNINFSALIKKSIEEFCKKKDCTKGGKGGKL